MTSDWSPVWKSHFSHLSDPRRVLCRINVFTEYKAHKRNRHVTNRYDSSNKKQKSLQILQIVALLHYFTPSTKSQRYCVSQIHILIIYIHPPTSPQSIAPPDALVNSAKLFNRYCSPPLLPLALLASQTPWTLKYWFSMNEVPALLFLLAQLRLFFLIRLFLLD